jgi:hypothetical protein
VHAVARLPVGLADDQLISQLAQHQYQVPLVLSGLEDPVLEEVYQARGFLIITRTGIEVPRFLKAYFPD